MEIETKKCKDCEVIKSLSEFYPCGKFLSSYCKICNVNRSRAWRARNPEKKKQQSKDWYRNNIESCKEKGKVWYAANREKEKIRRKKYYLDNIDKFKNNNKQNYYQNRLKYVLDNNSINMNFSDFTIWYNLQDKFCSICKVKENDLGKSLCVDHDHKTEQPRGLLCTDCNRGLGSLKDDPELLESAIKYLAKHKNKDQDELQRS